MTTAAENPEENRIPTNAEPGLLLGCGVLGDGAENKVSLSRPQTTPPSGNDPEPIPRYIEHAYNHRREIVKRQN